MLPRRTAPITAGRVLALSAVFWTAVVAVLMLVGGLSGAGEDDHGTRRDPCGAPDTKVTAPYAVTGYWLFPDGDRCGARKALQGMHRIGGDTVITSGPELQVRQVDLQGRLLRQDGTPDPDFRDCVQRGRTCYQAALDTLRAGSAGNSIAQVYAMASRDGLGDAALRCARSDARIVAGGRIYHRLLLPVADPASGACDLSAGRPYALVLIAGSADDWTAGLLGDADRFGMKVYAGLPSFPTQPRRSWNVDVAHRDVALAVNRVVLEDYARRLRGHPSFAGVYQTFEVRLRDWPNPGQDPNLQTYTAQHAAVRELLPGRKILVSPYWDARRRTGDPTGPAAIEKGVEAVAGTGADIIAPQDGRGTGKGALYWEHEAGKPVDPRLKPVPGVGESTYGQAYLAPTGAYYAAAARARDALARAGRPFELWANIEGFEPTAAGGCAADTARGRTDKVRLDRAVTAAGGAVGKIVSFKWNGLFTCREGRPATLSEEIAADWDRPILTGAVRHREGGRDGLLLSGHRLEGAGVTLTWYDDHWTQQNRIVRAEPRGGGRLWVPFGVTGLAPRFWIHVDVVNATGKIASNPYSLRY
ncbi:DUF4434 domain-containing protein [Actinomadura macrotermitis]|uniref:DUF4434 domain-containing protein n=1 Tax=Actinomadura macrotermitis TaxID=2585200 RepID=UPI0012966AC4|nr:DUF4434 domain-containing protein [Actinomadura macrotermitis]